MSRTDRWIKPLVIPSPAPTSDEPPPADAPTAQGIGDAWPIFGAILVCLAVVLLLNTKALIGVVNLRHSGPTRTVLLAVARTLDRAATRVGLDRPAAWLAYAQADRGSVPTFANPGTTPQPAPPVAAIPPTAVPTASPTPVPTPGESPTAAAGGPEVPPTATVIATSGPTATPTVTPRRAITPDNPLRVYVAGDSIVYGLAEVLAEIGARDGLAKTLGDVHSASGLARPEFFDWPNRLRAALSANPPPEAVVFMVGANDGVELHTAGGDLEYGTPEWNAEYGRRAAEIMDIVGQHGARLYYVGQPVMRDAKQSRIANDINIAVAKAAADRPWVVYIDSWSLLVDQNGEYSTFLVDANGETVKARNDDGIHLTSISTVWVANAVYGVIRKDWGLGR